MGEVSNKNVLEKEIGIISHLEPEDYDKLNVKCGLEIHQQLNVGKLFCECSSDFETNDLKQNFYNDGFFNLDYNNLNYKDNKINKSNDKNKVESNDDIDYKSLGLIKRYLRASAGEIGHVDIAAKYEEQKAKFYLYRLLPKYSCLVELDEEPPHKINERALKCGIKLGLMMNMHLVDVAFPMRKIVIDGSNTTGFQRTILLAQDGYVEINTININSNITKSSNLTNNSNGSNDTKNNKIMKTKRIGIQTLCIEEDAAKIIDRNPKFDIYSLDRLGIPLVEIATAPDIKTPKELRMCAEHIGFILRSFEEVKRGLGTIRQDINISILGANRVEIKGAQDLKTLAKVMEKEIIRQYNLYRFSDYVKKRFFKGSNRESNRDHNMIKLECKVCDITHVFSNTKSKLIKKLIDQNKRVMGTRIKDFRGLLGVNILPGMRIGKELSDYIKSSLGVSGLMHSDELPAYGISEEEVKHIYSELRCHDNDGFVIVIDEAKKAAKALKAAVKRLELICKEGVPSEVRRINPDLTTSFLRPMPGAARMYPETDLEPIVIDSKIVDELKKVLPKTINEKLLSYVNKYQIKPEIAKKILRLNIDLEKYTKKYKTLKPSYIADVFLGIGGEIKRIFKEDYQPKKEHIEKVLEALDKGIVAKESVPEILYKAKEVANIDDIDRIIRLYKVLSDKELETTIRGIILRYIAKKGFKVEGKDNKSQKKIRPSIEENDKKKIIGIVMQELRGKAPGERIIRFINKIIKELSDKNNSNGNKER